jgi:hypothetical protein
MGLLGQGIRAVVGLIVMPPGTGRPTVRASGDPDTSPALFENPGSG